MFPPSDVMLMSTNAMNGNISPGPETMLQQQQQHLPQVIVIASFSSFIIWNVKKHFHFFKGFAKFTSDFAISTCQCESTPFAAGFAETAGK